MNQTASAQTPNNKPAGEIPPRASSAHSMGSTSNDTTIKFTTFGGVFTPSILTIFGVIMFMRAGFVIGNAGIIGALLILVLSKSITTITGLSISAIATNLDVKGGGAYYLISRTLGPEFGATIGLTLFLAQTLSVPFYVLGFTEALVRSIPVLQPFFIYISITITIALFIITYRGASWAIKVQYGIMAAMVLSIVAFMSGSLLHFNSSLLHTNLKPLENSGFSFWGLFAIYFPAATGIMAGVNMSGNLKNPTRSIPLGTLGAIVVATIVYGAQIIICGGAIPREVLINKPYHSLLQIAPFHTGFLVTIGVFSATLSSAIGSLLGGPRVLQSLGEDRILKPINFFSGSSKSGEPHRALILTFIVGLFVVYLVGNGSEGGALNTVASIVTMLFLWTYGITNLAAFVESFSRIPHFGPDSSFFTGFLLSPALVPALRYLFWSMQLRQHSL